MSTRAEDTVEHLIIGDLGTLLLVLGLTGPVLAPVLRIGFFDRLRVLAHPLVAFPLWAVNLYFWHLPYFHVGAVHHDVVHALQHFAFVACGFNMWMALLGPLPKPAWFGNLKYFGGFGRGENPEPFEFAFGKAGVLMVVTRTDAAGSATMPVGFMICATGRTANVDWFLAHRKQ